MTCRNSIDRASLLHECWKSSSHFGSRKSVFTNQTTSRNSLIRGSALPSVGLILAPGQRNKVARLRNGYDDCLVGWSPGIGFAIGKSIAATDLSGHKSERYIWRHIQASDDEMELYSWFTRKAAGMDQRLQGILEQSNPFLVDEVRVVLNSITVQVVIVRWHEVLLIVDVRSHVPPPPR